jgi:hypothetical protein
VSVSPLPVPHKNFLLRRFFQQQRGSNRQTQQLAAVIFTEQWVIVFLCFVLAEFDQLQQRGDACTEVLAVFDEAFCGGMAMLVVP